MLLIVHSLACTEPYISIELKYWLFSAFSRRVIHVAVVELKAKTNMDIHITYKKTGKYITSVHFFFEEQAQGKLSH
jgi:plasmid replication initiation protein